jgi:hypothetical protein
MAVKHKIIVILFMFFGALEVFSQDTINRLSFFEPSDSILNKTRFRTAGVSAGVVYAGLSIALYNTWYKQYDRTHFHFFNDWQEWENVDKMGHIYTAYTQSLIVYKGARWAGLKEKNRILWGVALGSLFQSTIELMDGFSTEWGFSIPDFASNVLGVSTFALQQKHWGEQRILLKWSQGRIDYSDGIIFSNDGTTSSNLEVRADDLFGSSTPERFLKDYNGQTLWLSTNIRSFFPKANYVPKWLNVAVGYGAENMFGGFGNNFQIDGKNYNVTIEYPRYKQYYLSLDIDLSRIKTKSPFLKTLLSFLNVFKIPFPALEYNSLGKLEWHWLHF